MVTGVPSLNMNLITSAALTDICADNSPTVMVSPIATSRTTGPVGLWKPWALRFFSLALPRPPRRKPSLSSSVVRGATRGAGAFSLTEARCGAFLRSPSPPPPRRLLSSARGLSGRRGSSRCERLLHEQVQRQPEQPHAQLQQALQERRPRQYQQVAQQQAGGALLLRRDAWLLLQPSDEQHSLLRDVHPVRVCARLRFLPGCAVRRLSSCVLQR